MALYVVQFLGLYYTCIHTHRILTEIESIFHGFQTFVADKSPTCTKPGFKQEMSKTEMLQFGH